MRLWRRFWHGGGKTAVSTPTSAIPTDQRILINIPDLLDPDERHEQYAAPLGERLLEAEVGRLVEQRNWLQKRFSGLAIAGSQLVIETADLTQALPLIHTFLVEQECPAETAVCLFTPQKKQLLVYRDVLDFQSS